MKKAYWITLGVLVVFGFVIYIIISTKNNNEDLLEKENAINDETFWSDHTAAGVYQ